MDPEWRRLRAQVLREEPLCRSCGAPATDVDHIIPRAKGGTHHRANLQSLCRPCHRTKTQRDSAPVASRRRPPERHPGDVS